MRVGKFLLAFLLLLGLPGLASASSVLFVSGTIGGGPISNVDIQPFNPALGTLTSVEVTITGTVSAQVLTNPMTVMGSPIPTPYLVTVSQNFSGGPGNSLFSFLNPASFMLNGIGTGGVQTLTATFTDTFQFNSTTDIVGFSGVSFSSSAPEVPSALVSGTLSGFQGVAPFEIVQTTPGTNSPFGTIQSASTSGSILIEYDYTPATNTSPMPEPASLVLLSAGLAGLAFAASKTRV